MIMLQHSLYSNFNKHGHSADDKIRVDTFLDECNRTVLIAKQDYPYMILVKNWQMLPTGQLFTVTGQVVNKLSKLR